MFLYVLGCVNSYDEGYIAGEVDGYEAGYSDARSEMEDDLAALEARLSAIEADYLTSDDQVDLEGQISAQGEGYARVITRDEILTVGPSGEHANLNDALASLQDAIIAAGATVTLQILESHSYDKEPVLVNHRDGASIIIQGDPDNPGDYNLSFFGSNGIVVEKGYGLGGLYGVTLIGDGTSGTSGVLVQDNAWLHLDDVVAQGFGSAGFRSLWGGLIRQESDEPGLVSSLNSHGFYAVAGGLIRVREAASSDNSSYGYYAIKGGHITAQQSTATDNDGTGFYATIGSYIDAQDATSEDNGGGGFVASQHSLISAEDATSSNNSGTNAFNAGSQSLIDADSSTCSSGEVCYHVGLNGVLFAGSTSADGSSKDYQAEFSGVIDAGSTSGSYSPSTTSDEYSEVGSYIYK